MVICYTIGNHLLFVGVDKFENEGLIKYSQRYMEQLHTNIYWFHVDQVSSPHAYVQLNEGETTIPPDLIKLCAQIVKDGSIEGVKKPSVDVIYTPCTNLLKSKSMNVGTVSFHSGSKIQYLRGVRKDPQLLKILSKARFDQTILSMEKELDDLIANSKKLHKSLPKPEDDDLFADDSNEGFPDEPEEKLTDQLQSAEFNTHLEDDFM